MTVTRRSGAAAMSEADWASRVHDYAQLRGWLAHHQRPAMKKDGRWMSAIEGDRGYPDWTFSRRGVVLAAELKREDGKPTADQLAWLEALGPHGRLWRPPDWPEVLRDLR